MALNIAAFHALLEVKAGAAGAFLNMIKALKRRGHEIDVYTLKISDGIKEELERDFNVFVPKFKELKYGYLNFLNLTRSIPHIKKVKQKISKNQYDIIFISHYYYSPVLLFLLRKNKIPKVYYCYEPPRIYYEPVMYTERSTRVASILLKNLTLPVKYIDKVGVRSANLVLCNSYYIREYIWKTYGIFATTNYLGVDLEKHRKLDVPKENIILTVGVIQPHKAHDFVIRSLGLIPKSKRPKFIIITSGHSTNKKYMERLYKLAELYEINLEIINKYIPDDEFAYLHSKARIFVIPYIMEPSIEPVAFAYELPIVAVKEGGAREVIIEHETGILTERDEKEFAEAIEFLLDNPKIAEEMGKKGREWIKENFTWEKCAENLEKNFEKVLKKERHEINPPNRLKGVKNP